MSTLSISPDAEEDLDSGMAYLGTTPYLSTRPQSMSHCLTPKAFYEKYVGLNLNDYISIINAPTADKPYHRSYSVKFLGSVKEGRPVRYLNLEIEELKKAAIAQMKDGVPVWFGCDVGKCSPPRTPPAAPPTDISCPPRSGTYTHRTSHRS